MSAEGTHVAEGDGQRRPTRRELRREETLDDIKRCALEHLADSGAPGLSLRAIARDLAMSSAGIYRYFPSRDELIVALIADGFSSLGAALTPPTDETGSPAERLAMAFDRYRSWAHDHPNLFSLVFTDPIPGFTAPAEGPTDHAVRSALAPIAALVAEVAMTDADTEPDFVDAAIQVWAAVHGFVSLELFHHLDWADTDLDVLFEAHARSAIDDLMRSRTGR